MGRKMQGKTNNRLSPMMERYCRLRLTGADPLDCMERAGYKLDQNADRKTLVKKANTYDRNPIIQERLAELRDQNTLLEGEQRAGFSPAFFKELDLSENPMSVTWVNQAAYTVYRQALGVDNFHQCLNTLKFIAELNGFTTAPKSGRPKHDKAPNDNESSFNHDTGLDTGTPTEDEGFALEFAGDDGSDGEESPRTRTSSKKVRASSAKSQETTPDDDDGLDGLDQWDPGVDGED
jgi:hypothetical protein